MPDSPLAKAFFSRSSASRCSASVASGLAASRRPRRDCARGGLRGSAVGRFGLLELSRVASRDLNISQADLCVAIAQVRQLPIVLLRQCRVAVFQGFIGKALIRQAGTAAQAERDGEAQ